MNIDFTKKYYRKQDIENYIKDGDPYRKPTKITGVEFYLKLDDYPKAVYNYDELVLEEDLDKFITGMLTDSKNRKKDILNSKEKK